jgi:L-lactate permease
MYDLDSLQQTLNTKVTDSVTSGVQDQLGKLIAWVLIPSIVLTLIILIAYIAHIVHRHKVDKAIFEIRDTLREMKLKDMPIATSPMPTPPVAAATNEVEPQAPAQGL